MLSKRALALSPDKAFAKRVAAGLSAAGATVESYATVEELPKGELKADVVVLHLPDQAEAIVAQILPRLAEETRVVAIIATSSLEKTVALMKAAPRIAAVLVADVFEPASLSSVTSRLLYGDVFGLEKIVPWGVRVYSLLVGDYQEKSVAISTVSDFAGAMGVRRKYRESIEQCLDEMLMNALYDAPVDSAGKQMFSEIPTKTRISLRMEQKAVVQYACDGNTFALSVRDGFGALKGETVIKYLDKCLHSEQQIDRKTGGAGLGLYIISNAATQFVVNIYPQIATEAVCTFDLNAPKVQLKEMGLFVERIDASGRIAAGPSKLVGSPQGAAPPLAGRGITILLSGAIVVMLGLIAAVAYPRLRPTPRAALRVTTDPPGALIALDGSDKGPSPLTLPDLEVGQMHKITASKEGYQPTVELAASHEGGAAVALRLTALPSTLIINSTPEGATLLVDGQALGPTPRTLRDFPPESEHAIVLQQTGYQDLAQTVKLPGPGVRAEMTLPMSLADDVSTAVIDSDPPGAEVWQDGRRLPGVKTPVPAGKLLLQAGVPTQFSLRLAGFMPDVSTVTARPGEKVDIKGKLKAGGSLEVETNIPEAKVSILGSKDPACFAVEKLTNCPLENGAYKIHIVAPRPWINDNLDVTIASADVTKSLQFGFVSTANDATIVLGSAPDHRITKAAYLEGTHDITVAGPDGKQVTKTVHIVAGHEVTVTP